ncbi:hypothetical protein DXG01_006731 [Tephrocybe rancida]|nr:hypothetical protein DXG01_006731 [Tephrocybe rancida]
MPGHIRRRWSLDEHSALMRLVRLEAEKIELDHAVKCARAEYGTFLNQRVSFAADLPPEILALIFETACLRPPQPLMEQTLSHVSSKWRSVAIATSSLWTNVEIQVARRTRAFDTYLDRSRPRNIDITINLSRIVHSKTIDAMWERLEYDDALERCRSLNLVAKLNPLKTIYPTLRHLAFYSMPFLERLSVDFKHYRGPEDMIPPLPLTILSGGAPRLSSLHLTGCALHTHLPPLTGLTTLHIHGLIPETLWTYATFSEFLGRLTSLERLSLHGEPIVDDNEYERDHKIRLPALRELRLRCDDYEDQFPSLLVNVIAPSLETLHLFSCNSYDIHGFDEAYSSGPAFPSLNHLILEAPEFNAKSLRKLARILPSVKQLTCIGQLKPAYRALRAPSLWPNLQTVRFWSHLNSDMDIMRLRSLVLRWISCNRPIPSLCVANKPPSFPNWLLRDLVPSFKLMDCPAPWPEWFAI